MLKNEVHTSNNKDIELPDNPLYLTSQQMDELGYTSDQNHQPIVLTTDLKAKPKINPKTDVFPNNKSIHLCQGILQCPFIQFRI